MLLLTRVRRQDGRREPESGRLAPRAGRCGNCWPRPAARRRRPSAPTPTCSPATPPCTAPPTSGSPSTCTPTPPNGPSPARSCSAPEEPRPPGTALRGRPLPPAVRRRHAAAPADRAVDRRLGHRLVRGVHHGRQPQPADRLRRRGRPPRGHRGSRRPDPGPAWRTGGTTPGRSSAPAASSPPPHTDGESGHIYHFSRAYPLHLWTAGADWLLKPLVDHDETRGERDPRLAAALAEVALFYEDFLTRTDADGHLVDRAVVLPGEPSARTPSWGAVNAAMDISAARHALRTAAALPPGPPTPTAGARSPTGSRRTGSTPTARSPSGPGPASTTRYDHRHLSHLYGVWPLDEINPYDTPGARRGRPPRPRTARAPRTTRRTATSTTPWSRPGCGTPNASRTPSATSWQGDFFHDSLMSAPLPEPRTSTTPTPPTPCPPCSIETLVQSTRTGSSCCPRCPAAYPSGELRGIRTRFGAELDLTWTPAAPRPSCAPAAPTASNSGLPPARDRSTCVAGEDHVLTLGTWYSLPRLPPTHGRDTMATRTLRKITKALLAPALALGATVGSRLGPRLGRRLELLRPVGQHQPERLHALQQHLGLRRGQPVRLGQLRHQLGSLGRPPQHRRHQVLPQLQEGRSTRRSPRSARSPAATTSPSRRPARTTPRTTSGTPTTTTRSCSGSTTPAPSARSAPRRAPSPSAATPGPSTRATTARTRSSRSSARSNSTLRHRQHPADPEVDQEHQGLVRRRDHRRRAVRLRDHLVVRRSRLRHQQPDGQQQLTVTA